MIAATAILIASSSMFAQESPSKGDRDKWVGSVINEIQTIKIGMTRGRLRKVFLEEGGISTTTHRTYVFRECSYIKVDFVFEARGPKTKDAEGRTWQKESDADVIVGMSKPYLQFAIMD